MLRVDIQGIFFDLGLFIRRNRFKFFMALIMVLLGATLGIISAPIAGDAARQSLLRYNLFLVMMGERSFFGYFLFRFLFLWIMIIIVSILNVRPLIAWASYSVILLFSYQHTVLIFISFSYAGLSILPLMLLCIVPFFLIKLFLLSYYASLLLCASYRCSVTRFVDISYYTRTIFNPFIIATLVIVFLSALEAALVSLLTIGVLI